jgi:hypothetical protein
VPGFLTTFAYLIVLAIVIGITAALALGLRRMDRDRDRRADIAAAALGGQPGSYGATTVVAEKQSAEITR